MKTIREKIIVEPLPLPAVQGGVHLVRNHHPSPLATVLAIGGDIASQLPDLVVGARVAIRPMGGTELDFHGRKLRVMTLDDVLALVEPDATLTTSD